MNDRHGRVVTTTSITATTSPVGHSVAIPAGAKQVLHEMRIKRTGGTTASTVTWTLTEAVTSRQLGTGTTENLDLHHIFDDPTLDQASAPTLSIQVDAGPQDVDVELVTSIR